MTTLIDHPPALGDQQHGRRTQVYHDLFAWPTTFDNSTGEVWLRLGTVVDALVVRAGFGGEVNNVLVRHMFHAPIIVVPGSPADWIFLTRPRTTMRQSVWEDLARIHVGWKRRGEAVLLPTLDNSDDGLRWLERPRQHAELPPWTAVVAAARKASSSVCGAW